MNDTTRSSADDDLGPHSLEILDQGIWAAFLAEPANPALVSFPRTGSHLFRATLELVAKRPFLIRAFFCQAADRFLAWHTHDEDLTFQRQRVIYLCRNIPETIFSQLMYCHEPVDRYSSIVHWTTQYAKHLQKWLFTESFSTDKLVVRYEELVDAPMSVIEKAARFLGVPWNEREAAAAIRDITPERIRRLVCRDDPDVIPSCKEYGQQRKWFTAKFEPLMRHIAGLVDSRIPAVAFPPPPPAAARMLQTPGRKLVGLLSVRNEAHLISPCLRALSMVTDAIVVLDDASDDGTSDQVAALSRSCRVEKLLRKDRWERDEPGDRTMALQAGRLIGGTHFIVLDADELLTANLAISPWFRPLLLSLERGESLEVNWLNLWRSLNYVRVDSSFHSQQTKAIAFCDDGTAFYASDFIHTERCPDTLQGRRIALDSVDFGLMHFQYVNWRNLLVKQAWYQCLERVHHPERPAEMIAQRYRGTTDEQGLTLRLAPREWSAQYPFLKPSLFEHRDTWRLDQMLAWFQKEGVEPFANLAIWDPLIWEGTPLERRCTAADGASYLIPTGRPSTADIERQHRETLRQLHDMRRHFTLSEADRAARLRVIEQQGAEIDRLRRELADKPKQ